MPQAPANEESLALREQVRSWLEAYDLAVVDVPASTELQWLVHASGKIGAYSVACSDKDWGQLVIHASITFTQDDPPLVSDAVLADIVVGLLAFDIDLDGLANPLREVNLSTPVCCEQLNREQFTRALRRVNKAMIYINERLRIATMRTLGDPN